MNGPYHVVAELARPQQLELRRRMIFEFGKNDPQCGDVDVLAPFALALEHAEWLRIAGLAEALAAETTAAEREAAERPELLRHLGLPRSLRRALAGASWSDAPRFLRFDFHWTADGWRISEVNSDVPGGFIETCGLARLMAEHAPGAESAGDPAAALARAIRSRLGTGAHIGLVHATAYVDDRQVMLFLARILQAHGLPAHAISPAHVSWGPEGATMRAAWRTGPLDALIRFYPAEWLPALGRDSRAWFQPSGSTLHCNPATALITQSKRFPLIWQDLDCAMDHWRRLLPETRDPRHAGRDERWVLKPALGRVGGGILLAGITPPEVAKQARRWSRLLPSRWAAQRRFNAIPIHAAGRDWFPCLGVYVIDGRAAGVYGRIAPRPFIDWRARDVAVLVAQPRTTRAPEGASDERPAAV